MLNNMSRKLLVTKTLRLTEKSCDVFDFDSFSIYCNLVYCNFLFRIHLNWII